MPTHEWDWHIAPSSRIDDPFETITGIAVVAVRLSDLHAFEIALERCLACLDEVAAFTPKKAKADKAMLYLKAHAKSCLKRISVSASQSDKTGAFARKLLDVCSIYVTGKTTSHRQTSAETIAVLEMMEFVAQHCLENRFDDTALIPVVVTRQLIQKGLDDPPKGKEGPELWLFPHSLARMTNVIKELSRCAIRVSDSNFLYRCFDALGWLGCSAMKTNNHEVGKACLRALAQLGRESRAAKLECFWSKCALPPINHARERIWWIASWMKSIPEQSKDHWQRSINEAFSRIEGKGVTTEYKEQDGKLVCEIHVSNEPHRCSYSQEWGSRTVDYSDESFLKDLELY